MTLYPHILNTLLQLTDAVVITDINHNVVAVNKTYTDITGYMAEEIIGQKASMLRTKYTPKSMYDDMKASLLQLKGWSGIFTNKSKYGKLWTSSITITPYVIDNSTYYVGIFRVLEDLKRGHYLDEKRIGHLQYVLLKVLAMSCEIQDPSIEEHLLRVQEMTSLLLKKYNELEQIPMSEGQMNNMVSASILHDIGKAAIPEGILYKPSQLAKHERKIIEMHTYTGLDIFEKIYSELDEELIVEQYQYAKNIILYHHERYDGTGYPEQLKGEQIPLEARIVSVVDVFDALTTKRPYKDKWTQEQAIDYIFKQKGTQFDPKIVDAFIALYDDGVLKNY